MSVPDIIWDGTGTHAAAIVQHLRRDGYAARLCQSRWEIHAIDRAGAIHRIHPKETP